MRKIKLIPLVLILIFLLGCTQNQPFQEYKSQSSESNLKTTPSSNRTPTPLLEKPTPSFTPPPLVMTPVHPGTVVMDFIEFYNERNATKLYEMLSDRIKKNVSIEDVREELNFAETRNITLSPNEKLFAKSGLMENGTTIYTANITISYENGVKNATIEFRILYTRYITEKDNLTYIGFQPTIDAWIFEEIRRSIKDRQ